MELFAVWLLFWLPLSIAVAILASRYDRSGIGWFIASVLFSPLIGAAFVLALGPLSHTHMRTGYQPTTGERAPDNPPNQGSAGRKPDMFAGLPRYARLNNW
jgi:hypothetical protein